MYRNHHRQLFCQLSFESFFRDSGFNSSALIDGSIVMHFFDVDSLVSYDWLDSF